MTRHISKHIHDTLIDNLIESKMPISIIVDDTTDAGNVHYKSRIKLVKKKKSGEKCRTQTTSSSKKASMQS